MRIFRLYYPLRNRRGEPAGRLVELDFLRGMAILMVLLSHYPMFPLFVPGWSGVDLFFVLSGFLVGGLLLAEFNAFGRVDVGRFLVRRGLKIYPSFYFFLALTVVGTLVVRSAGIPLFSIDINARTLVAEVFYLQNYLGGIWGPNWTLAVEEHFYLLLALFFVLAGNSPKTVRRLALVALSVIPLVLALRFLHVRGSVGEEAAASWVVLQTHLRLDSLFFGVLLACVYHNYRHWLDGIRIGVWAFLVLAGAGMAAWWLAVVPAYHFATATVGYTILYVAYGLVLIGLLQLGERAGSGGWGRYFRASWAVRVIANMGVYSYSIYLWHAFVLESLYALVNTLNGGNIYLPYAWRYLFAYLVLSIGLGYFMARLVEYPVLAWRNRKFPSRREPLLRPQSKEG